MYVYIHVCEYKCLHTHMYYDIDRESIFYIYNENTPTSSFWGEIKI
jgi:hypothetical protein